MRFVLSYAAGAVSISLSGNITEHCTKANYLTLNIPYFYFSTFLQLKTTVPYCLRKVWFVNAIIVYKECTNYGTRS
jgi:hypothetical protein